MSVSVTFIFLQIVLKCPIFGQYCPKKHIFKACNNTIYCPIQSTLYFKKNILYCPIITFIFLQNIVKCPIFGQYCPKKHILKACINTKYCPIQSILYFKKNILYCPIIIFIFLQKQREMPHFSDIIVPKNTFWKHVITPYIVRFSLFYISKKHLMLSHNNTIYCPF